MQFQFVENMTLIHLCSWQSLLVQLLLFPPPPYLLCSCVLLSSSIKMTQEEMPQVPHWNLALLLCQGCPPAAPSILPVEALRQTTTFWDTLTPAVSSSTVTTSSITTTTTTTPMQMCPSHLRSATPAAPLKGLPQFWRLGDQAALLALLTTIRQV